MSDHNFSNVKSLRCGNGRSAEDAERLVAELEAVEGRLRHLQDGLARAHRLATLGTMASILAHEFNNILTPIISYCELARRSPDDPKLAAKAIEKSLRGAERAAQVSASMLGFARDAHGAGGGYGGGGESGGDEGSGASGASGVGGGGGGDAAGCRVDEVVRDVLAMLARPPERDGIRLEVDVPADCRVAMGPVHLQQVMLNLVLNARAAMVGQGGGGVLRISATAGGLNTGIEVSDTGPGIPPEVLPRVFEPFVTRGSAGRGSADEAAGEVGGTGLGLAICRDLVRRAGGEITIRRSGPEGTTFRVEMATCGGGELQIEN